MIAIDNDVPLTREALLASARPFNAHAIALPVTRDENESLWLEARRFFIGGSEALAAASLDPWRSATRLYLEHRGEVEREEPKNAEALRFGNLLEDVVAGEFAERTGLAVQRVNSILVSRQWPWMSANLDRRVVGQNAVLEIKTTNPFVAKSEWGDDGDNLPMRVQMQVQQYLAVTGWHRGYVAVLIGGQEMKTFTIDRDEKLIEALVKITADLQRRIEVGEPPAPVTYAEACERFPKHVTAPIEATPAIVDAVIALKDAKARKKAAEADEDAAQVAITSFLGECDELQDCGKTLLTWRTQSTTRINTDLFREEMPQMFERYSRTTTSRVMRLKESKKK